MSEYFSGMLYSFCCYVTQFCDIFLLTAAYLWHTLKLGLSPEDLFQGLIQSKVSTVVITCSSLYLVVLCPCSWPVIVWWCTLK